MVFGPNMRALFAQALRFGTRFFQTHDGNDVALCGGLAFRRLRDIEDVVNDLKSETERAANWAIASLDSH